MAGRDVIQKSEIEAIAASTAYDVISRLRPEWIRQSVSSGSGAPVTLAYLDNVRLGTIDALRTVSSAGIASITWYDAVRAASTLPDAGRQPIHGAIAIRTR